MTTTRRRTDPGPANERRPIAPRHLPTTTGPRVSTPTTTRDQAVPQRSRTTTSRSSTLSTSGSSWSTSSGATRQSAVEVYDAGRARSGCSPSSRARTRVRSPGRGCDGRSTGTIAGLDRTRRLEGAWRRVGSPADAWAGWPGAADLSSAGDALRRRRARYAADGERRAGPADALSQAASPPPPRRTPQAMPRAMRGRRWPGSRTRYRLGPEPETATAAAPAVTAARRRLPPGTRPGAAPGAGGRLIAWPRRSSSTVRSASTTSGRAAEVEDGVLQRHVVGSSGPRRRVQKSSVGHGEGDVEGWDVEAPW